MWFCYCSFLSEMAPFNFVRLRISAATAILFLLLPLLALSTCGVERRKSDAELGLNPQQADGRHVYDQYCDRCHAPYSSRGRQGPSLQGMFKKPYLSASGMPANDDRVRDIILLGRNKMEGFSNILTAAQINDLIAYLHTL
jgi:mono/diheme cytochrome c family protein